MTNGESGNVLFKYGKFPMMVSRNTSSVPYATFFAGVYDFLRPTKQDIVIDAGANVGDYSLKVAGRTGRVIAIEPDPENLNLLYHNLSPFKNVYIVNKAISDHEGSTSFLAGRGIASKVDDSGMEFVEMDTLDSICYQLEVGPTLLKMDIEGEEGRALKGFKHHLMDIKRLVS